MIPSSETNAPTLSIITVCRNAEATIARTLQSVHEQTYPHIEHLIIDGQSDDQTLELVRRLAPRALVHSAPDQGIYDAMNRGLARATGDYVWFLNAGDALPEATTVERMFHDAFKKSTSTPDIIYGDCLLIDSEGRIVGPRRLRPPHKLRWKTFRKGMLVCHQSFVARRAICPWYNLKYKLSSDFDWCIRVMKKAHHYRHIDWPLSLYLNEGATTEHHFSSLCERFQIMRYYFGLKTTILWHVLFAIGWPRGNH